jgi:NCS2 family nucleobase:cation symporter-2
MLDLAIQNDIVLDQDAIAAGATAFGVDDVPPPRQLLPLAIQHVLLVIAGAIGLPLLVGRALNLSTGALTVLISADLVACGIATLIQTIGLPKIGIRLPIMMGVTFASVSPMLAMIATGTASGQPPDMVLTTIYGAVIAAGVFGFVVAPFVSRLTRFFPAVVTGSIILVIGLSLVRITVEWAGGGKASSPDFGAPINLGIAAATMLIVLVVMKLGRYAMRNCAVLVAVAGGTAIASLLGRTDFRFVQNAAWVGLVRPFQFGPPRFEVGPIVAMCLAMVIVMIESLGMFLAAGEIVGRPANGQALTRGLRGDAAGTVIGGIFNTFVYTSYSQNIGLLSLTGVRSRYVCAVAGAILLLFGLCPKLGAAAASVPPPVLGGAGLVMAGMIVATGIRIVAASELTSERMITVSVAVAAGLIPVMSDHFFQHVPAYLAPLLHSGVVLASVTALLMNAVFVGTGKNASSVAQSEPGGGQVE